MVTSSTFGRVGDESRDVPAPQPAASITAVRAETAVNADLIGYAKRDYPPLHTYVRNALTTSKPVRNSPDEVEDDEETLRHDT